MRYGQLKLTAEGGLNEVFMASCAGPCRLFAAAAAELHTLLADLPPRQGLGQQRRIDRH